MTQLTSDSCVYTDEMTIIKGVPRLLKALVSLASRLKPEASLMTACCYKNHRVQLRWCRTPLRFSRGEDAEAGCGRFSGLGESSSVLLAMGEHCWETLGTYQPLCDKTQLLPAKGVHEQPKWKRAQDCASQTTRKPQGTQERLRLHEGESLT